jgi:hypothetical protein
MMRQIPTFILTSEAFSAMGRGVFQHNALVKIPESDKFSKPVARFGSCSHLLSGGISPFFSEASREKHSNLLTSAGKTVP